jgi:hypothetical protein
VETFWIHDVPMSSSRFSASEKGVMSLSCRVYLRQFFSPLVGFFWFVSGFVETYHVTLLFAPLLGWITLTLDIVLGGGPPEPDGAVEA